MLDLKFTLSDADQATVEAVVGDADAWLRANVEALVAQCRGIRKAQELAKHGITASGLTDDEHDLILAMRGAEKADTAEADSAAAQARLEAVAAKEAAEAAEADEASKAKEQAEADAAAQAAAEAEAAAKAQAEAAAKAEADLAAASEAAKKRRRRGM